MHIIVTPPTEEESRKFAEAFMRPQQPIGPVDFDFAKEVCVCPHCNKIVNIGKPIDYGTGYDYEQPPFPSE